MQRITPQLPHCCKRERFKRLLAPYAPATDRHGLTLKYVIFLNLALATILALLAGMGFGLQHF
ncbi:MAG TPA: hypothetical protein VKQ36_05890 [Ktedonobacterales bacterium]|nr:hypothetical protein [Ktedonobacterales bacterium]